MVDGRLRRMSWWNPKQTPVASFARGGEGLQQQPSAKLGSQAPNLWIKASATFKAAAANCREILVRSKEARKGYPRRPAQARLHDSCLAKIPKRLPIFGGLISKEILLSGPVDELGVLACADEVQNEGRKRDIKCSSKCKPVKTGRRQASISDASSWSVKLRHGWPCQHRYKAALPQKDLVNVTWITFIFRAD